MSEPPHHCIRGSPFVIPQPRQGERDDYVVLLTGNDAAAGGTGKDRSRAAAATTR
jgi:hypothetical protein